MGSGRTERRRRNKQRFILKQQAKIQALQKELYDKNSTKMSNIAALKVSDALQRDDSPNQGHHVGDYNTDGLIGAVCPTSAFPVTTNSPTKMIDQGPDFQITPRVEANKSMCTAVWVYRADNSLARSGMNVW